MAMRSLLALTGVLLLCACPSHAPASGEDAGTPGTPASGLPADHLPPSRVEHPPTGQGLPDDLKPPAH